MREIKHGDRRKTACPAGIPESEEYLRIYGFFGGSKDRNDTERISPTWQESLASRVNGDIMDFFRVRSKDDFEIGAYAILEPKGESKAGKEEARDGFMVVPGVAFDADRNRIGFGGGYYDKYLELYPELFTAAVAFGFQIVEGVPTEANDIRPQKLITEERIYE